MASKIGGLDAPRNALMNVSWRFDIKPFTDRARFIARVTREQVGSSHAEAWQPDQIAIRRRRVTIRYHGLEKPGDLDYTEYVIELVADDGQSFTAGELLFKLHNAVYKRLRRADHRYFEGLIRKSAASVRGAPTYQMQHGS